MERILDIQKLKQDELRYQKVYIYGAGAVGKTVLEYLHIHDIIVEAVIVTEDEADRPIHLLRVPIKTIDNIEDREILVIVATLEKTQPEILESLKAKNIHQIFCMKDVLYRQWELELLSERTPEGNYMIRYQEPYLNTFEILCKKKGKNAEEIRSLEENLLNNWDERLLYLPRLVVVLGTKCSLRCKECNNLIPHFKPQAEQNIDTILASLERIANVSHSILKCELIGGEPFLSKNLKPVLQYLLSNTRFEAIEITTNGMIIPTDEIIQIMKEEKITVRLSDYGEIVDKERMIKVLCDNGIDYEVLTEKWISSGGTKKREKTTDELKLNYYRCYPGYYCKTLYDGKLYACARAASLHALGYMKEDEYINLMELLDIDELKEFLLQNHSIACDYCDAEDDEKRYVAPAEQLVN